MCEFDELDLEDLKMIEEITKDLDPIVDEMPEDFVFEGQDEMEAMGDEYVEEEPVNDSFEELLLNTEIKALSIDDCKIIEPAPKAESVKTEEKGQLAFIF